MRAIDFHVHPGTNEDIEAGGKYAEASFRYFRRKQVPVTVEELAEKYRSLDIQGVLLAWDCESNTGIPPLTNDYVADIVSRYSSIFFGFACVDPLKGKPALAELERAVGKLGLHGAKFHPTMQGFYPNDKNYYPLWKKCQELKLPVIFHTGTSSFGGASPGGSGLRLDPARPIYLDPVAGDFPDLTIIAAHTGWPWHEELMAMALHKSNIYIDLSGWSPRYLPAVVVQYANTLLSDRFLFGSDHPYIEPTRWLADFEKAEFKPEVRPKILLENAKRILQL